ncbi:hypothetical protein [Bacillus sp. T33-2]|uniref:hypothetical protein n=1 Tax=Bacillus sp. T33-2 TaxID=2054168 RepID=UPI000C75D6D1|nr:hypothetical protein [Bacillus sp. T33-2]PLR95221.1 hypothetical protein CVD19_14675 [Bacillus sp. T33-2]
MEVSKEERKHIFRTELAALKKHGYITAEDYTIVSNAHVSYIHFLETVKNQKDESYKALASKNPDAERAVAQLHNLRQVEANTDQLAEVAVKNRQAERGKSTIQTAKKKLSPEEFRERNISWSLNLGVIFLLIGGLFVATSNWATMTDLMKSCSIALVSVLFYGIAYIAWRILRIEKTAFAFIVLGSLFLPIFILSLGWFELLGSFLSFSGDGRYVLGMLGSLPLVPVYSLIANRLKSRLFVWFSLVSLTVGAGFLLRQIAGEADAFFMGIMVYNSLLVVSFYFIRKKGAFQLFTKELAPFAQVNLVLSTLLMVLFYENHVFYGFNLLLTAAVYMSMIYVSGKKEYHFVFTAMLVYGAYQIFDSWNFREASQVGYSLLGFVFLAVSAMLGKQLQLNKVFHWTSGIVSGLSFLFITMEGIMLRSAEPSVFLILAYFVIAANFIYLANTDMNWLFIYLSSFFLASALFEIVRHLDMWIGFQSFALPAFLTGFILNIVFGWLIKVQYMKAVRLSSRDIGLAIMVLAALAAAGLFQWAELGCMFTALAGIFFLIFKREERRGFKEAARWLIPISAGMSVLAFGEEIRQWSNFYAANLGLPGHFIMAGFVLLLTSFLWKRSGHSRLTSSSSYTAVLFYSVGLLLTAACPMDVLWAKPAAWLTGVGLYVGFYRFTHFKWLSFVTGAVALLSYFSILDGLSFVLFFTRLMETFMPVGGGLVLLVTALALNKKDRILSAGFAWVAHAYLVFAILITLIVFGQDSVWAFIFALAAYAMNIRFVSLEWKSKALLYGAFTTLFLALQTGIELYTEGANSQFAFLSSSIIMALFWLFSNNEFKNRTIFYLIPFSLLGIGSFLTTYPFSLTLYVIVLVYTAGLLALLHKVKWDLMAVIPLLLLFAGTTELVSLVSIGWAQEILLFAAIGAVLLAAGRFFYTAIWTSGGQLGVKTFDAYSAVAFVFFVSIYFLDMETLWAKMIPGILISGALWLQRDRVQARYSSAVIFLAGAYLFQPYYSVVGELDIPPLWYREALVLPVVMLSIFLRHVLKTRMTGQIQWGVLIMVAILLVQDGLASSTVYDALILGSLSLISMLAGMWLRVKSYFFVGAGVLLLNVILQTRPFWGNMPWWAYLLVAGSILIIVASFNEWNKQKTAKGDVTFLVRIRDKITGGLRHWK